MLWDGGVVINDLSSFLYKKIYFLIYLFRSNITEMEIYIKHIYILLLASSVICILHITVCSLCLLQHIPASCWRHTHTANYAITLGLTSLWTKSSCYKFYFFIISFALLSTHLFASCYSGCLIADAILVWSASLGVNKQWHHLKYGTTCSAYAMLSMMWTSSDRAVLCCCRQCSHR